MVGSLQKGFLFFAFFRRTRGGRGWAWKKRHALCACLALLTHFELPFARLKNATKKKRQRTLSIPQNPILFSYLVNNFMSSGFNAAGTWSTLFLSAYVRSFSSSSSSGFISSSAGSCWLSANDDRPSGKLSPNIQRTLCPLLCSNWAVGTRNT